MRCWVSTWAKRGKAGTDKKKNVKELDDGRVQTKFSKTYLGKKRKTSKPPDPEVSCSLPFPTHRSTTPSLCPRWQRCNQAHRHWHPTAQAAGTFIDSGGSVLLWNSRTDKAGRTCENLNPESGGAPSNLQSLPHCSPVPHSIDQITSAPQAGNAMEGRTESTIATKAPELIIKLRKDDTRATWATASGAAVQQACRCPECYN